MKNFIIKKISSKSALIIWKSCSNSSIFTNPVFLEYINEKIEYWGGFKGEKLICYWPICLDKRNDIIEPPFCYYIGPVWHHSYSLLPAYRWFSTSQIMYNQFIQILIKNYSSIVFSIKDTDPDLRSFNWWNYNLDNKPKFRIDVKYTAIINNLGAKSDEEIINGFRNDDRRKQIKKLLKQELNLGYSGPKSSKSIIDLYLETISRTNGKASSKDVLVLEKIIKYIEIDKGEIICIKKKDSNKLIAAQIMLDCNKTTNAVAQGTTSNSEIKNLAVLLNYMSIISARNRGSNFFDFNGANSPNRADDKHSYGADLKSYFKINYPYFD